MPWFDTFWKIGFTWYWEMVIPILGYYLFVVPFTLKKLSLQNSLVSNRPLTPVMSGVQHLWRRVVHFYTPAECPPCFEHDSRMFRWATPGSINNYRYYVFQILDKQSIQWTCQALRKTGKWYRVFRISNLIATPKILSFHVSDVVIMWRFFSSCKAWLMEHSSAM